MSETAIQPAKNKGGRISTYTEAIGIQVAGAYANGMTWRQIDADPKLPASRTILGWLTDNRDGFRDIFTYARAIRGDDAIQKATLALEGCDPDGGDPRTASSRVSLANYRAAHYRHLAARFDPEMWGERTKLDVETKAAILVAFADMKPVATMVAVDDVAEAVAALPIVIAPDGADAAPDGGAEDEE